MTQTVEVWYGGKKEARDPLYGLPLTPGINRVAVDRATLLILKGVVIETDKARRESRRRK